MAPLNTGLLMFIAQRHVEMRVLEHLRERGYDDITVAQGRLAARLSDDGMRLTDLAAAAQVTKQTAAFLVGQLERAGYVERVPDPSDARARLIRIAPRGLAAQREARTVEREISREWEQHLGVARMSALQEALTALREITDPWADQA